MCDNCTAASSDRKPAVSGALLRCARDDLDAAWGLPKAPGLLALQSKPIRWSHGGCPVKVTRKGILTDPGLTKATASEDLGLGRSNE